MFRCRLGFDKLQYYVSTDAKELLLHAGLHALIAPAQGKGIPSIGRILLQCDGEGNSKYSEAVAAALAHELEVSFAQQIEWTQARRLD